MPLRYSYTHGRPMMTAKLQKGQNKARYFELLIDSGADFTLISKADARLLGIEYKELKEKERKVEVANLAYIHTKKVRMKIELGYENLNIPVLVARENVERLLGRKGVFSNYSITFKESDSEVVFRRR